MSRPAAIVLLLLALAAAGAGVYFALAPDNTPSHGDAPEITTDPNSAGESNGAREIATETSKPSLARVTSTLSGRVVDSTGAALRARIELGEELLGETDEDGNFTKIPFPARRDADTLVISASEWHTPVVFSLTDNPRPPMRPLRLSLGENVLGKIQLTVSGAVEGYVVNDLASAVAGARVSLTGLHGTRLAVTTNSAGAFLLTRVPPGTVNLMISLNGEKTIPPPLTVQAQKKAAAGSIVLPRAATERVSSGKIVNTADGEPVGGARIQLVGAQMESGFPPEGFSDGMGKFTIPGIRDTRKLIQIEVEAHGYPKKSFGPMPSEGSNLILSLDGGPRFELFVTDAMSGAPIEEFGAWSCSPQKRGVDDERPPITKRPGGIVRLTSCTPSRTRVVVDAPGYPIFEGHVDFSKKMPEVRIPPGSKVKLRILANNRSLAGAKVFISNPSPPGKSALSAFIRDANVADVSISEFRVDQSGADQGRVIPEIRARETDREKVTDKSGNVEFAGIPPGKYVAVITDKNGGRTRSALFEVHSGLPVEMTLHALVPGSLTGHLVADSPNSYIIAIKRDDADDPNFRTNGQAGPDGAFTITGLMPGHYRATVQYPGESGAPNFDSPAAVAFEIGNGAVTTIQLDTTREERGVIAGSLQFPGLRPEILQIKWSRTAPPPTIQGSAVNVDASGVVRLDRVPAGKVTLQIRSGDVVLANHGPIDVKPGDVAPFQLSFTLGALRVRAGGNGNQSFSITLPAPAESFVKAATLPTEFTIPTPEGDVIISATIDGKVQTQRIHINAGVESIVDF